MKIKRIATTIVLLSLALPAWSLSEASKSVSLKASQLLNEISVWESNQLKHVLSRKIAENQFLLAFLNEYHDQLELTEHDRSFEYFSKSLIEDQKSLVFISEHLSVIGSSESLNFDLILSSNTMLKTEFDGMLKYNMSMVGSRSFVNRILYHGLMDKYAI